MCKGKNLEVKRQKKKGINGELKIENYELRIEKMINHKAKQIQVALICHDFINFGVTLITNGSFGLKLATVRVEHIKDDK